MQVHSYAAYEAPLFSSLRPTLLRLHLPASTSLVIRVKIKNPCYVGKGYPVSNNTRSCTITTTLRGTRMTGTDTLPLQKPSVKAFAAPYRGLSFITFHNPSEAKQHKLRRAVKSHAATYAASNQNLSDNSHRLLGEDSSSDSPHGDIGQGKRLPSARKRRRKYRNRNVVLDSDVLLRSQWEEFRRDAVILLGPLQRPSRQSHVARVEPSK